MKSLPASPLLVLLQEHPSQVNFRNSLLGDAHLVICIKTVTYLQTQQNNLSEVSESCTKQEDFSSCSIKLRTSFDFCWKRPLCIFDDFL